MRFDHVFSKRELWAIDDVHLDVQAFPCSLEREKPIAYDFLAAEIPLRGTMKILPAVIGVWHLDARFYFGFLLSRSRLPRWLFPRSSSHSLLLAITTLFRLAVFFPRISSAAHLAVIQSRIRRPMASDGEVKDRPPHKMSPLVSFPIRN